MNLLRESIIKTRQDQAPKLKEILDKNKIAIERICNFINAAKPVISDETGPDNKKLKELCSEISSVKTSFEKLNTNIERKYKRFKDGLIGIAVCGLTKAGKSTFLTNLTGIELPSSRQICTAVSTEIVYVDENEREYAKIDYYLSEGQFLKEVINPKLEVINIPIVNSIYQFENLDIPKKGETGEKQKMLNELTNLKSVVDIIKSNIGNKSEEIDDFARLKEFIAFPSNDEKQKAEGKEQIGRVYTAKRCTIYRNFEGGSNSLRIIDTSGIDDPNTKVVEDTFRVLEDETDVLLTISRPADPDPKNDFIQFWKRLNKLPDEINFIERLIFVLNWDKNRDQNKEVIIEHRKILENTYGVPMSVFTEPVDCSEKEDALKVMNKVNQFLDDNLQIIDNKNVEKFKSEYHKLYKVKLFKICEELQKLSPTDSSFLEIEIKEFDKWFKTFHENLSSNFSEIIKLYYNHPPFSTNKIKLNDCLNQARPKINEKIPNDRQMNDRLAKSAGKGTVFDDYMKEFYLEFSNVLEDLAKVGESFAPVIQRSILNVLEDAGLHVLMNGNTSQEKIKSIYDTLDDKTTDIAKSLEKIFTLKSQMRMIMRYELRPALNLLNVRLWDDASAWQEFQNLFKDESEKVKEKIGIIDLSQFTNKNIVKGNATDMANLINDVYKGFKYILSKQTDKISKIALDLMLDMELRLSWGNEEALRDSLRPIRSIILKERLAPLKEKSDKLSKLRIAIDYLINDIKS